MGSFSRYEMLFEHLVKPLFFRTRAFSSERSLVVKLNIIWVSLFVIGHLVPGICIWKQYHQELTFPDSMREVYLVFLAAFSIANQAQLWARVNVPARRGEYFLLLWALTMSVLWCNQFFFGRPYPEEATSIVIGVVSIYTASLVSTAMQVRRGSASTH